MDIICFCHLRWNFVYQRPQHLLSRFALQNRVFVIEEPLFDTASSFLDVKTTSKNIWILVPHLPSGLSNEEIINQQQRLLNEWQQEITIRKYIAWFYTPMALPIADAFPAPALIIYDCMDELSAFKNAPASLKKMETVLMWKADLVFTGGYSLYQAKKEMHPDIHPYPSSIDKKHFAKARLKGTMLPDQTEIPNPRIGFFGVVDERFNIGLLEKVALEKPDWHFVIVGPTVKIDPASLPAAPNIHYTGSRSYDELPAYLSGWDVALIPFALNESTQFISPTKTPEYLAGGVPVVSTSIRDVVNPYGESGLVYIADTAEDFIKGIEWGLIKKNDATWLEAVDNFLENISWDVTWLKMTMQIQKKLESKNLDNLIQKENEYV